MCTSALCTQRFGSAENAAKLHLLDGDERSASTCSTLYVYVTQLMTHKLKREMPQLFQYPYWAASLCEPDVELRQYRRSGMYRHLHVVLEIDAFLLVPGNLWVAVIKDIYWWGHDFSRLFLNLVEREGEYRSLEIGGDSYDLAEMIARCSIDEKGPEDLHQHCRDRQRQLRHNSIGMSSLYSAVRDSRVLEDRSFTTHKVDKVRLAAESWQGVKAKRAIRTQYKATPSYVPPAFRKMLNPNKAWPTPDVDAQCRSMVAWHWVTFYDSLSVAERPEPNSSWWSRLLPIYPVYRPSDADPHTMCFFSGNFGYVCFDLEESSDGCWMLPRHGRGHTHTFVMYAVTKPRWLFWSSLLQYLVTVSWCGRALL